MAKWGGYKSTHIMKIKIKILIVPKFEIGTMDDGVIGEAELYWQEYMKNSRQVILPGGKILYVSGEIALVVTGEGKVNAAITLTQVLSHPDFDFSECYIIGTGCAGGIAGNCIMGDVVLVTSVADFDLGHRVDLSEISDKNHGGWFRDSTFDDYAFKRLNTALIDRIYNGVKDIRLGTTPKTENAMKSNFSSMYPKLRNPKVIKGSGVTGDNYWKGEIGHEIALKIAESYGCEDPLAVTEMEDVAIASVAEKFGLLDRLIIIRDCVNMDLFMNGATPESTWLDGKEFSEMVQSEKGEAVDIFETSRYNNFRVGKAIIELLAE